MRLYPDVFLREHTSFTALITAHPNAHGIAVARTLAEQLLHDYTPREEIPKSVRDDSRVYEYLAPHHLESELRCFRLRQWGGASVELMADEPALTTITIVLKPKANCSGTDRHHLSFHLHLDGSLKEVGAFLGHMAPNVLMRASAT